ncbi:MAG: hypothetical protein A2133_09715 [Actinobacteria bacterium RBG_16_64_13]|nr:MAG: hypothetical protein A2133_09715 [Actinobacteria bacterium RBG_16_64_13]
MLFDGSHPGNRALKLAADLAIHAGAEIGVLTVDDDAQKGTATIAEARAYLDPLGLKAAYAVVPGRPAEAAVAALVKDPADMVIMGKRGHSPLRHLILGGEAEQLMRSVELPVLLVS